MKKHLKHLKRNAVRIKAVKEEIATIEKFVIDYPNDKRAKIDLGFRRIDLDNYLRLQMFELEKLQSKLKRYEY